MLFQYLLNFFRKCLSRLTRPGETGHVSWRELFFYTARQAFHNWRGTFTGSLKTYSPCSPELASLETPWGRLYVPQAVDRESLHYLLRETSDKKHWHQYESPWTPVSDTDILVDCGASEGLWALSVVQRSRKAYLVEPQPAFVQALEKTFAPHLDGGRAEILNCALGETDGTGRLTVRQEADILGTVTPDTEGAIPLRRMDSLFSETPVTFIKADIEGLEMELLRGAAALIKRCRPKIAVTVYHEANDWRAMRDYVLSLVPQYRWKLKGMIAWGKPIMLYMWVESE